MISSIDIDVYAASPLVILAPEALNVDVIFLRNQNFSVKAADRF